MPLPLPRSLPPAVRTELLDLHHRQDAVIMHNGPLTRAQQQAVAVLAGGGVCALAARSAAANAGLAGWEAELVEVVVPRGTTYPRLALADVKVHESRRFTVEQRRLTDADRLREELDRAGKVRHHRLLGAVLSDIGGGAHAVSELDFLRFCRRNGLPMPTHQAVRRDSRGRRRYLDATLVGPRGRVVRVEIDGALHLVVQTYWADMYRGNDLSIGKETALRFPSFVIYANDLEALDQLRRALDLSGPGKTAAA